MEDTPPITFRSDPVSLGGSIGRMADYASSPVGPKFVWALVAIQIIFQVIDTYTTYIGVVLQGGSEANPIMNLGFELTGNPLAVMLTAKVFAMALVVILTRWILRQGFIKWPMRIMFFVDFFYALAMLWNVAQLYGIL